jgi:hypothetical protein
MSPNGYIHEYNEELAIKSLFKTMEEFIRMTAVDNLETLP